MTRRLTENKAIMVRMLASRCRILNRTFRVAVTIPDTAPASMAMPVAAQGFHSPRISVAATAAPSGKLPSTVRSGKSRTRKDRKTPRATRAYTSPSSAAPSRATTLIGNSPAGGVLSLADHFRCPSNDGLRNGDTHGLGRLGIDMKVGSLGGPHGDISRLLPLEHPCHDLAGLAADLIIVEAEGGDRAALNAIGIAAEDRQFVLGTDDQQGLQGG